MRFKRWLIPALLTALSLNSDFAPVNKISTSAVQLRDGSGRHDSGIFKYAGIADDLLQKKTITQVECKTFLDNLLGDIHPLTSIGPEHTLPSDLGSRIESLWKLRQIVHGKLKDQQYAEPWPEQCLKTVKMILNTIRLYEDQLVERWMLQQGTTNVSQPFSGRFPHLLRPSGAQWTNLAEQLQIGDVVIERSVNFYAGVIAKLSRGEFNHCGVVYKDESGNVSIIQMGKDGLKEERLRQYTLNNSQACLLQEGCESYGKNLSRVVVLRFGDPEIAKNATQWLIKNLGKVEFDYGTNIDDGKKQYRCESLSLAFTKASKELGRPIHMPNYLSDISPFYDTPFFKLAGFEKLRIFHPDDLEVDNRFSIVGEWRDPKLFRKMFYHNVIFEGLFDSMVSGEYKEDTTVSNLARVIKYLRDNFGIFSGQMGKNTPLGVIELGIRLHRVSGTLEDTLAGVDRGDNPLSVDELTLHTRTFLKQRAPKNYFPISTEFQTQ